MIRVARREKPKHPGQVTLVSTHLLHCTHLLVIFWSSFFLLIIISSSTQRICLWNKILVTSHTSEPSFWVCHDFLLSCSLLLPSSASFLGLSCPLYPPTLPDQSFSQSNVYVRPIPPSLLKAAFCTFSTPRYLNSTQPLFSTVLPPRWVLGFSRGLRVVESRSCEVVGNLTTRRGNPTHCTAGHCSQQSLEAPTAPRKRYTAKIRSPTNAQNIFLYHEGEKTSTVVGKR